MAATPTIDHALRFHRSGDLQKAEQVYLAILNRNPNHADALHLLGMLCSQTDRVDEAETLIGRAIEISPKQAVYYSNLGSVLSAAGKGAAAIEVYRKATRIDPRSPEAFNNLAVALCKAGQANGGIEAFKSALLLRPDYADALKNLTGILTALWGDARAQHMLGDLFQEMRQYEPAIACYRKAIAVDGASAESWNNLGNALFENGDRQQAIGSYQSALKLRPDFPQACNNLANVLKEVGRYEEAIEAYRRSIELQPNSAEPLSNLGNLLREAGQWELAEQLYEQALALVPDHAATLNNMGNALCEKGRFTEAAGMYLRAIDARPNYADALNNLGTAWEETGQRDKAMACYQKAARLDPSAVSPPWNIALLQLLRGDYENGWTGYEHRWRQKKQSRSKRDFRQPMVVNIEQMKGKRILLHAEQGFGDAIQFSRYVALVAEHASEVIVECPRELRRLFENSFAKVHSRDTGLRPVPAAFEDQSLSIPNETSTGRTPASSVEPRPVSRGTVSDVRVIARGDVLPSFDLHCPLMTLPLVFGTRLSTIPAEMPYLFPDPADEQRWQARFANQPPGLKVGLVWAGQSTHQKDRHRSLTLGDFANLRSIAGVQFYSLQVGEAAAQAKSPPSDLIDWTDELADFAESAALISQLDLVITVDTAVCHLAGAMGKPVWILLAYQPDWRWLLDRTDSPWYPTARLFRQAEAENWAGPLRAVTDELKMLVVAII